MDHFRLLEPTTGSYLHSQFKILEAIAGYYPHNALTETNLQCSRIWDPVHARFESCFIPVIAIIPAGVSICILLLFGLQLLPLGWLSPRWLRRFVEEPSKVQNEEVFGQVRKHRFGRSMIFLLIVSIIGFVLQLLTIFYPRYTVEQAFPSASWAFAILIIGIYRPTSTPYSLLVLHISIFVSQFAVLLNDIRALRVEYLPALLVLFSSLGANFLILFMPMRDPSLQFNHISDPFTPPTSELRSPEDNVTLWQWMTVSWMAPLIKLGNTRQLDDDDVWFLGYEFQHKKLHDRFRELQGSVLTRLVEANGLDLFIISVLAILEQLANFSAPVFLQKILQSMENPDAPKRAALTYAALSLIVRLIASQSAIFSLWFGRRAYERSRGEMITMLYEKTLSRKVVSVSSKARAGSNSLQNGNSIVKKTTRSCWTRLVHFLRRPFGTKEGKSDESQELASMGKIMNLMRFDAYEVAQRFWEFSMLITIPLGLVLAVTLIWRLIGWPCLIGVVTILFAQIMNALFARALLSWEKERRVATDVKLHKISQLVEAIRHLRYYGWQDVWLARIMESRQHELHLRIVTSIWSILISFTNTFASGMFPVAAFYAYTVWAGQPLQVDIAFPALQLFGMLETSLRDLPNLITVLLNAKVAVERLEMFMQEPDKEIGEEQGHNVDVRLEMAHATFAWPGAQEPVLKDISLSFPPGLTVVCGEVGSGKTALLQALLGELDQQAGDYHRSNEMVGYCSQTPWLQSMSIRDNIVFSSPYDEARYREVLDACALIPDMASFKHGDLSMIGENGIGLSGGQRARVALARAVYSSSRIVLLDDPLSALDHQTADIIVRRCLSGSLMQHRTTILVTHRTELCVNIAQQVVQISAGKPRILTSDSIPSSTLQSMKDRANEEEERKSAQQQLAAIPEKFMEDEHRAHGGVMASVYWEYIKAGKLKWWFVLILVLALYRLIEVGETWFLKQWGEAYTSPAINSNPFDGLPSPELDIRPWLIGFFLIAAAQSIAFLVSQGFMLVIVYKAGKELFERVVTKVAHATFRFYDITPVGRLMNRLTSDINTVDGNISNQFQNVAMLLIAWVSSVVVIGSVTPFFLVFAIALTLAFVMIFLHFLPTSQSLRRLEMVSLSPLISNFGALVDGLTTVRAFCAQYRFQDRVIAVTDNFQKMDHFYWSLQAWLMYRFDNLSACSTFLLTSLALYTGVSPGLTAFVLTAASKFVISTHALCKQYGQLQMDFVSVERVVELLHLEQEPPGSVLPPAWWPTLGGDIIFENVTIQYAPHLDPAISEVSFKIKGGSTTALIGRTGSGKSTLALSLLATTLPTSGRILIDGIDISTVDTQALRQRVTFLAQDPVLFPGSMRQNLDPLDEYSDFECSAVLEKIAERHNWTLDMHIDTGGKNLSQGQRQLVGLARALLRRSPIVIMDEATASIDMETATRIQEILREELKEATVITIAHRAEAVKNANSVIVLGKGKLLEQGEPNVMSSMV